MVVVSGLNRVDRNRLEDVDEDSNMVVSGLSGID